MCVGGVLVDDGRSVICVRLQQACAGERERERGRVAGGKRQAV
jgi:hypothetical protein